MIVDNEWSNGRWQEVVESNCCRIDDVYDVYGGIDGVKIVECADTGVDLEVLMVR